MECSNTFQSLQQNHTALTEKVKRQFPHDDLNFPEETVVLKDIDGITWLKSREVDDEEIEVLEDMSRPVEIGLDSWSKRNATSTITFLVRFSSLPPSLYSSPSCSVSQFYLQIISIQSLAVLYRDRPR